MMMNPGKEEPSTPSMSVSVREKAEIPITSISRNARISAVHSLKPDSALQLTILLPHTKPCKSPPRIFPSTSHKQKANPCSTSHQILLCPPRSHTLPPPKYKREMVKPNLAIRKDRKV